MEFLETIAPGTWLLLGVVCALSCGVMVILFLGIQILGGALEIFTGVFELIGGFLGGGPISCCGCIILIGGCGICGLFISWGAGMLQTCGTPDAVNFCRLLGY